LRPSSYTLQLFPSFLKRYTQRQESRYIRDSFVRKIVKTTLLESLVMIIFELLTPIVSHSLRWGLFGSQVSHLKSILKHNNPLSQILEKNDFKKWRANTNKIQLRAKLSVVNIFTIFGLRLLLHHFTWLLYSSNLLTY
jgi:hypothetical protein